MLRLVNSSGWTNYEYFLKVLQHFIDFMKSSKDATTVLFWENHINHISLEVTDLAYENNLFTITFLLTAAIACSH